MKVLLSCQRLSKTFAHHDLFCDLDFTLYEQDKIGLIGANGAGKSTLLRLIARELEPDSGEVVARLGVRLHYLDQSPQLDLAATVSSYLKSKCLAASFSETESDAKVANAIGESQLDDIELAKLSGGNRKRVAILGHLVQEPDFFLLDEPTNHLDFEGVLWLEKLLQRSKFGFLVVSHDRYFLDNVVTKTAEISRIYDKGILILDGGYTRFLDQREAFLAGRAAELKSLANKLRREEAWLARGPQARSTKAQYRIDEALELRDEFQNLKNRLAKRDLSYNFASQERRTKKLIELTKVSIGYSEPLIKELSLCLGPGKIVGIVGLNGVGKTTLLEALYSNNHVLSGSITKAPDLSIAYFDQHRRALDDDKDLKSALYEESDSVVYQDRLIHINAWAQMFGFDPRRLNTKVKELSGGERARVLISHLIRKKADVLLLDEPTNDLDIQSLNVLEDSLSAFPGGIVLITHDRYFLTRLCDEIIGFVRKGEVKLYADYAQWEREFLEAQRPILAKPGRDIADLSKPRVKNRAPKLSYKDQREYDQIESEIARTEVRVKTCEDATHSIAPDDHQGLTKAYAELSEAQASLERLYDRWAELEAILAESQK